jgi:hypothetical protein
MALDVGAAEGAEGTGSATPDGASPWPALGLTPLAFPNGSLTLRVVVTWRDGATAAVEATLTVALTAWQDVAPGLSRTCGGCHATGNTFGRLALDRAETVATNIDEILCRADVHVTPRASLPECQPLAPRVPASMPPGTSALSPAQLAALRAWRDGGFRRSDRD